jgi:hypothetical protein
MVGLAPYPTVIPCDSLLLLTIPGVFLVLFLLYPVEVVGCVVVGLLWVFPVGDQQCLLGQMR